MRQFLRLCFDRRCCFVASDTLMVFFVVCSFVCLFVCSFVRLFVRSFVCVSACSHRSVLDCVALLGLITNWFEVALAATEFVECL